MVLVYFGIGWLAGVWLAAQVGGPSAGWLGVAGGAAALAWLTRRRQAAALWLSLAGVGAGGARYLAAVPVIDVGHVAYYNETADVALTGLVVVEPEMRDRSIRLRLQAETIRLPDGRERAVRGQVLVQAPRFPLVPYGARLQLHGRLETPPVLADFDYRAYLARQGIHSQLRLPTVAVVATGQGPAWRHAVSAFRARAGGVIRRLIPEPQAALLAGILLGDDHGLSPALQDAFRATGMTHIIAISGFNISLLIGILVALSQPLVSRRGAVPVAVVGIALYTVLVGADASVVRAAIMGGLYLVGRRWLGRPSLAAATLLLTAGLMTAVNPLTLWDVGFQLSFAATLSLMLYAAPLTDWSEARLTAWLGRPAARRVLGMLNDAVLVTLAAQALTLPLMAAYFGQLSPISLLANALILPAQPGVMVWGGLATLVGLAWPAAAQAAAWVANLFLGYTIFLVRALATAPGATVAVNVGPAAVVGVYAVIGAGTWLARLPPARRDRLLARLRRRAGRRLALGGSLAAALLTAGWGATQPDGRLHVVFFDVGQGDATFIQTPAGRQVLVDGGFYPSVLDERLGRQMPFWDRDIDLLVATHPDADHVAGLVGVFARYRVGWLITNGQGSGESDVYDAVLQAAAAAGTPVHRAQAGETIWLEESVRLAVLHPGPALAADRNENSVVLRLTHGAFSLLLTGDAEERAEEAILQRRAALPALVYKAGHHGSRTSSTASFLAAVRPQVIIVSAGRDNRFGHPHPEMLDRAADVGAAVLRTDVLGTIRLVTDGRRLGWQAAP